MLKVGYMRVKLKGRELKRENARVNKVFLCTRLT